jgi:hypothetical protein
MWLAWNQACSQMSLILTKPPKSCSSDFDKESKNTTCEKVSFAMLD